MINGQSMILLQEQKWFLQIRRSEGLQQAIAAGSFIVPHAIVLLS